MKKFITLYPDHVTVVIPHLNIDMCFLDRDLYEVEYTHDGYISAAVYLLYDRHDAPISILLPLAELIQDLFPKNNIDWTLTFLPMFDGPPLRWLSQPDDVLPEGTPGPYDAPVPTILIDHLIRHRLI